MTYVPITAKGHAVLLMFELMKHVYSNECQIHQKLNLTHILITNCGTYTYIYELTTNDYEGHIFNSHKHRQIGGLSFQHFLDPDNHMACEHDVIVNIEISIGIIMQKERCGVNASDYGHALRLRYVISIQCGFIGLACLREVQICLAHIDY